MSYINLPVSSLVAGTSPIIGGTTGSVLFVGIGPVMAQDNAVFFWDDTNNFLGIGTNTPAGALHVKSTTAATTFICDNVAQAVSIFIARDNGSAVFTIADGGAVAVTTTLSVADDPYGAGWSGSTNVPTKGAVYNKIEALGTSSGTYTPTLTNVANLDGSTAFQCQYLRVGNVVTVSGKVSVDPTLTASSTQLGISLPIASNLGTAQNCAGTAFASGITAQGAAILGDAANDRAQMQWISSDVTNQPMYFTFTYLVI